VTQQVTALVEAKVCSGCTRTLELSAFGWHMKRGKRTLQSFCKQCRAANTAARRFPHKHGSGDTRKGSTNKNMARKPTRGQQLQVKKRTDKPLPRNRSVVDPERAAAHRKLQELKEARELQRMIGEDFE
jgi:hypothetical protein